MSEQIPTPPEDLRIRGEHVRVAKRFMERHIAKLGKMGVPPDEIAELRHALQVIEWNATAPNPVVVSDVPRSVPSA